MKFMDLTVRDVFRLVTPFSCEFIKTHDSGFMTNAFNLTTLVTCGIKGTDEVIYIGQLSLTKDTK